MFRTNRSQPGVDTLERTAVLSDGVADPSSAWQRDTVQGLHLELNGTLHANKTNLMLDTRAPLAADSRIIGTTIAYFDTSGRLSLMGKVSGSFGPNKATDTAVGRLPNLSNLTLDLSNRTGSVQLTLAPSMTDLYQFKIAGGTGSYAAAYGSGSLTVSFREGSNEYLLVLRSGRS
jgi:hypothetical protein